ncbi:unnamed protein product, partial [Durusdinium trenchii]
MSLINPDLESHFNESLQHLFEDISDCYKNTAGSLLLVPSETMPDSARLLHGIHDVHEALAKGMKIECLQIHINYNDLPMTLDATVTEDYYCLLCVLEEDCKHVNLHLLSLKHVPQQQLQQRPVVLCAGRLTELGAISAGIFPAKTKTTPISSTPHRPLHPSSLRIVEDIRVSAEREPIKPSQDFKDFPRRLLHADRKERTRLLVGLHQRFYHCGVTDMIRLLNAMLLPRDVIQQGIEVCQQCSDCHCQRYANKAPRPQLRGYVAVQFNEYVLMDLFFLWSQPFILLIDHCTHWKTGCHLPNKQASSLLQALMSQWIRVWGPMHTLCSDQEGGLSSSEATVFCERLGITRTFVGTSAYHSKGLVERHVALTKHSMMILKSTSTKEGLHLSYDDLIHEVTISQNMLLEKGGVTPQTAVTGINPREFWQMDNEQLQAHTGALDVKADFAEQAIRGRLLAKQAILEAVVGERLAIARRTKQQKHDLSLLIAGMAIDIYRQPHRKDDFGWHGPAELVIIETNDNYKKKELDRSFDEGDAQKHQRPEKDDTAPPLPISSDAPGSSHEKQLLSILLRVTSSDELPDPASAALDNSESSPAPALDDSSATLDYGDRTDQTIEYPDDPNAVHRALSHATPFEGDLAFESAFQESNIFSFLCSRFGDNPFYSETISEQQQAHTMLKSLTPEFRAMWSDAVPDSEPLVEYLIDLSTGEILKVDDETANLTDQELIDYAPAVHLADYKELHQFV